MSSSCNSIVVVVLAIVVVEVEVVVAVVVVVVLVVLVVVVVAEFCCQGPGPRERPAHLTTRRSSRSGPAAATDSAELVDRQ